jgi:Xaa-Pro dipeptidase
LLFAEHDPILWDGADQMQVSRSRWDGDLREAANFTFFGSGPNSRRDAGTAVAAVYAELEERGLGS